MRFAPALSSLKLSVELSLVRAGEDPYHCAASLESRPASTFTSHLSSGSLGDLSEYLRRCQGSRAITCRGHGLTGRCSRLHPVGRHAAPVRARGPGPRVDLVIAECLHRLDDRYFGWFESEVEAQRTTRTASTSCRIPRPCDACAKVRPPWLRASSSTKPACARSSPDA